MSISRQMIEQLEGLNETRLEPAADADRVGASYTLDIPLEGQGRAQVKLALQDYDRYSVVLKGVEVAYGADQVVQPSLQQRAEQITHRLTYLEEPLGLVELDEAEGLVQLRSQPPRRDGETIIYWEAEITDRPGPTVRLNRYRWTPARPERESVSYPVTFARLGQMVEDITHSLLGDN